MYKESCVNNDETQNYVQNLPEREVLCEEFGVHFRNMALNSDGGQSNETTLKTMKDMLKSVMVELKCGERASPINSDHQIPPESYINLQENQQNQTVKDQEGSNVKQLLTEQKIILRPRNSSETSEPRHRRYSLKTSRIRTFAGWPHHKKPHLSVEIMTDAGFFYTGRSVLNFSA